MGPHFLDLDAGLVRTQDYALCQRAVADVLGAGATGIIHGQAGTGKTFAVEDAVAASGEPAVFLGFASRPTMRGMAEELCARLFDFDPGRTDLKSLTRLLRARLDVEPVPIVVDEAQRLNRECFEFLRYLHDPAERGLGGGPAFADAAGGRGSVLGRAGRRSHVAQPGLPAGALPAAQPRAGAGLDARVPPALP